MTLENILSGITTFVGMAVSWMGSVADTVVETPVLFLFVVAVPLVGLGVGLLKRVIHAN